MVEHWSNKPTVKGSIPFGTKIKKNIFFPPKTGVNWESNPGPLAPKARIMPLDH